MTEKMTVEKAIRLLDPNTSNDAITELEDLYGVDCMDRIIEQCREACILACKALSVYKEEL